MEDYRCDERCRKGGGALPLGVSVIAELQDLFRRNEPEIVLESFNVSQEAVLRFLDCDGYWLGCMPCHNVYTLCITTRSESFSSISFFESTNIDSRLSWLAAAIPDGC